MIILPKTYREVLHDQMIKLSKIKNSVFLGQQVAAEDFYGTLQKIPLSKRIEMPVAEELQMSISIGLALEGFLPISIFQRMDFLLRAADSLVNHLDLIADISDYKFDPKVIIRTTVGSTKPLDVGLQHNKNLVKGFEKLLNYVEVIDVKTPEEIEYAYEKAIETGKPIMIVEYQDLYETK